MNRVSSIRQRITVALVLIIGGGGGLGACRMEAQNTAPAKSGAVARDPQQVFAAGEVALRAGKLDEAERDFQQVVAMNPEVAGAYANLGVIHMRRKQWSKALVALQKAEKLAPDVAGIRLNIGLVYFRQNDFARAIRPFETVVKDAPNSYQARYLLGLCYFFNDRWTDTIEMMEPLWPQASSQLNYLYVLEHAADKAKNTALEERAAARLVEVGEGSAEFHLLMGKAHLNRGEYDDAVKELETAAKADPKLPFVHFNMGLAYSHKQDYERARIEFQKDIVIEPDVPFAYEQLGSLEATVGNEEEAEKNFRRALKLDPQRVDSLMGVAKIDEHAKRYPAALAELDSVIRLASANAGARYLRGQVLMRMGREKEGRVELASATKMLNEQRAARHKELEGETVPSPELAREPQ